MTAVVLSYISLLGRLLALLGLTVCAACLWARLPK